MVVLKCGSVRSFRFQFLSLFILGSLFAFGPQAAHADGLTLGSPIANGDVTITPISNGWQISYPSAASGVLYPGMNFSFSPEQDWSGADGLAFNVSNPANRPITVCARVDSSGDVDGLGAAARSLNACETVNPGETRSLALPYVLHHHLYGLSFTEASVRAMRAEKKIISPRTVSRLALSVKRPGAAGQVTFTNIHLVKNINPDGIIDQFGQNSRLSSRTGSYAEAKAKLVAELNIPRSRSPEWDPYGGCNNCFEVAGTNHFRVAKARGRWWIIDPNGHPFFSLGVNGINTTHEATLIAGREPIFAAPPPSDAQFNGTYSIHNNNISHLYPDLGVNWKENAVSRLVDWGFNTIGNWSDTSVLNGSSRRIPRVAYTRTAPNNRTFPRLPADHSKPKTLLLPGTTLPVPVFYGERNGFTTVFPDVFSTQYQNYLLKQKLKQGKKTLYGYFGSPELAAANQDSFCIGLFVDNELHWDGGAVEELSQLARAGLNANGLTVKKEMLALLTRRYKNIKILNKVWGTSFKAKSIAKLLNVPINLPDNVNPIVEADLADLLELYAGKYFQTVNAGMRRYLPNKLYLGSRFIGGEAPRAVLNAAARYVDVMSFNVYRTAAELREMDWASVTSYDKPILVSEFGFGAYDSGHFRPGPVVVDTQADRGAAYQDYVLSLMANPYFVGAHVYQYNDQPVSGRGGDFEGYNNGFVDSLDLPYTAYVNAVKALNRNVYSTLMAK